MKRWALRVGLGALVVVLLLITGLVGYVEATSASRLQFPDAPGPAITASSDPAIIERGRLIVHGVSHCAACHGTYDVEHFEELEADVPLSGGLAITPPFGVFYGANITPDRETGIGAWTDEEIARTIRTGVRRNGELSIFMKMAVGDLSDEDLTAVVSYLRSVAPVRHEVPAAAPNFMGRAFVAFAGLEPDSAVGVTGVLEGAEPSIERGRYLATGPCVCIDCHSPASADDMFAVDQARRFAGGQVMAGHSASEPDVEYAGPNLTSDPDTGFTGRSSEDQFVARFRTVGRTGRGSPMPWENFARMSDSDLRSIYRFIRSVPPIHRNNGPSSRVAGSFDPPE